MATLASSNNANLNNTFKIHRHNGVQQSMQKRSTFMFNLKLLALMAFHNILYINNIQNAFWPSRKTFCLGTILQGQFVVNLAKQ